MKTVIGTLTSVVANLHLGVLKKYGYNSNMLDGNNKNSPASIEVFDEFLLKEKQIQLAIEAGVIEYTPYAETTGKTSLDDNIKENSVHEGEEGELSEAGEKILSEILSDKIEGEEGKLSEPTSETTKNNKNKKGSRSGKK